MLGSPPSAAIAAEPVSPEVAATMVALAAACLQGAGEQPAQNLQRDILEGKGRAVKKLQQIFVPGNFPQRRDSPVAETGIGGFDIGFQIGGGKGIAGKVAEYFERHVLVARAGKSRDLAFA